MLLQTCDPSYKNMICRVQRCPTVLRKTVSDLFPYHSTEENSELSVITITLKPNIRHMRNNKELETEKMAQTVGKINLYCQETKQ